MLFFCRSQKSGERLIGKNYLLIHCGYTIMLHEGSSLNCTKTEICSHNSTLTVNMLCTLNFKVYLSG